MGVNVDAHEWSALGDEILADTSAVPARVDAGMEGLGHRMESTARTLAPERTGLLKSRIKARTAGGEIVMTAETDYAEYVEDGTSVMAPQPYMAPAFDQSVGQANDVLLDASLDL